MMRRRMRKVRAEMKQWRDSCVAGEEKEREERKKEERSWDEEVGGVLLSVWKRRKTAKRIVRMKRILRGSSRS